MMMPHLLSLRYQKGKTNALPRNVVSFRLAPSAPAISNGQVHREQDGLLSPALSSLRGRRGRRNAQRSPSRHLLFAPPVAKARCEWDGGMDLEKPDANHAQMRYL